MNTNRPDESPATSRGSSPPAPWSLGVSIAGLSGFLSVALGAFGAHGLKSGLLVGLDDAPKRLEWWETAVDYQMWHSLLLLAVAIGWPHLAPRTRSRMLFAFLVGVVLFSGSLYVMTLTGLRALGAITPVGGVSFLMLWALVAKNGWQSHHPKPPATHANP